MGANAGKVPRLHPAKSDRTQESDRFLLYLQKISLKKSKAAQPLRVAQKITAIRAALN